MDASKPQCAKQLKEHLQHHQEPFSLQNYLIERSYMFKNCNCDSSSIHSFYSAKNLKWSIKYDLHKIRKRFLHATGVLRSLLYKFISTDDNQEFSRWDEEHNSDPYHVHEIITAEYQATQQTNEIFSLKRLAVSDYFTDTEFEDKVLHHENHSSTLVDMFQTFTLPKLRRPEVDTGVKPYWISSKEKYNRGSKWREPLPNAVCHLKSPEGTVTPLQTLPQKLDRDPVFSTYLRKLLVNSNILKFRRARKDKLQGMVETTSQKRRILQKRKQLPFECVEKDKGFDKSVPVSEAKGLQNVINEHFSLLEKQYREVKKITHLLHTESCVISEEWKSFQIVNWEIQMEIGDSIMDDIVREIIDFF
ncbi:hypothetical protein SESBI_40604 [Sesbania bispinosa]|nr:hypothetical protein SESBI_40604 [Sesbania bispinosa]